MPYIKINENNIEFIEELGDSFDPIEGPEEHSFLPGDMLIVLNQAVEDEQANPVDEVQICSIKLKAEWLEEIDEDVDCLAMVGVRKGDNGVDEVLNGKDHYAALPCPPFTDREQEEIC